jgi:hypothetical protein
VLVEVLRQQASRDDRLGRALEDLAVGRLRLGLLTGQVEGVGHLLPEHRVVGPRLDGPLEVRGRRRVVAVPEQQPPEVLAHDGGVGVADEDGLVLDRGLLGAPGQIEGAGVLHLQAFVEARGRAMLREGLLPMAGLPEGVGQIASVARVVGIRTHCGPELGDRSQRVAGVEEPPAGVVVADPGDVRQGGLGQLGRLRADREHAGIRPLRGRRGRDVAVGAEAQGPKRQHRDEEDRRRRQ